MQLMHRRVPRKQPMQQKPADAADTPKQPRKSEAAVVKPADAAEVKPADASKGEGAANATDTSKQLKKKIKAAEV